MKTTRKPSEQKSSNIEIHEGQALIKVAATYATIYSILLELIQNSLDANASKIWITINQKISSITSRDNGDGVSEATFNRALESVFDSIKDRGKLGRFGIGMISPLGKCTSFSFTSSDSSNKFHEWEFVTADIKRQRSDISIPCLDRNEISYNPTRAKKEKGRFVDWRTMVKIKGFTAKQAMGSFSPEKLEREVLVRFSQSMRKLGARIYIRVKGQTKDRDYEISVSSRFTGIKLEQATYKDQDGSSTSFELYVVKKSGKAARGQVLIAQTGDPFTLPFSVLTETEVGRKSLPPAIAEALNSGLFEGIIQNDQISPDVDRKSFDESNDAIFYLCYHIETWWQEHGARVYEDLMDKGRHERYQDIGIRSMEALKEGIENDDTLKLFYSYALDSLQEGTIGRGHLPKGKKEIGKQENPSLSATPKGKEESKTTAETKETPPEHDLPKHSPGSVQGPKGRRRTRVKNDSLGIQFSYELMEGSRNLWDFDIKSGVLTFNTRHPVWERCESCKTPSKRDKALIRLHTLVSSFVLTTCSIDPDIQPVITEHFHSVAELFSWFIAKDDELTKFTKGK